VLLATIVIEQKGKLGLVTKQSFLKPLPEIIKEIDELVSKIATLISHFPPDKLLCFSWWVYAAQVVQEKRDLAMDSDLTHAARMIDYVQSVIASVEPAQNYEKDVPQESWEELSRNIEKLFNLISLNYQLASTQNNNSIEASNVEIERFRRDCVLSWMNIRGKRYLVHEKKALRDILSPHSEEFMKLFGIDSETLINEITKILEKQIYGVAEVFDKLQKLGFRQHISSDNEIQYISDNDKHIDDNELHEIKDVLEDFALFEVNKICNLPMSLLEELSWSPGQDTEFFSGGDFSGWPLRIWPTMKRPFILYNNRVFCFDTFSLFDNFYRVLQRIIFKLDPSYKRIWNEKQKEVSEELPLKYLEQLLPGAKIYRSIYYGEKKSQRCEADALLLYDDYLFVIEVKGGAFAYTSPETDIPAHLSSLESLIQKPANQGHRFVKFLKKHNDVPIFDSAGNKLLQLKIKDFSKIFVCAVTLDSFTELAARAQHLTALGIELKEGSTWSLSIDDLRVYADLFDNPLVFLHYVSKRMTGASSREVELYDEMEHLGLYFDQNSYIQSIMEQQGIDNADFIMVNGFRHIIDNYYTSLIYGDEVNLPTQRIPFKIREIIDFLAKSNKPSRSKIVEHLLDASGGYRNMISDAIVHLLSEHINNGKLKICSFGGPYGFSIRAFSTSNLFANEQIVYLVQQEVIIKNETDRLLLELEYSKDYKLIGVYWKIINLENLSPEYMHQLQASFLELRKKRLEAARVHGKIKVNGLCPCESGLKYKKCCRKSNL
jgi:hypothetical protein